MAKVVKEKEPKNVISQNAILVETINKEKRFERLYTNYGINPFRKSKFSFIAHVLCFYIHNYVFKLNETYFMP